MAKWFRGSLMLVGLSFMVFIVGMFVAMGTIGEESYTTGIGAIILLISLLFSIIAIFTGIGAAFQWLLGRATGAKAKRGLVYEDEMLNRIMQRLTDEERSYLQGYVAVQTYEPVEGFDYIMDDMQKQNYK